MNAAVCRPLLASLVAIAVCLGADDPATATNRVQRIGVEEYDRLLANTNTIVLDVRSVAEFEKGHIPRATNINVNSLHFIERVSVLDKDKTYLVNCAVGMRSEKACKKMEKLGFVRLYDLAPGFDGWRKAGKPVEK